MRGPALVMARVQERVRAQVPEQAREQETVLVQVTARARVRVLETVLETERVPVRAKEPARWWRWALGPWVVRCRRRHRRMRSTRGKPEAPKCESVAHQFSSWETHVAFAEFELASAGSDGACGYALFLDAGHHSRVSLFAPVRGRPIDQHHDAIAKADEEIDMREEPEEPREVTAELQVAQR